MPNIGWNLKFGKDEPLATPEPAFRVWSGSVMPAPLFHAYIASVNLPENWSGGSCFAGLRSPDVLVQHLRLQSIVDQSA